MKKWALTGLILAMLAAPMLACGFPLPAGTSMMAVSKAVCAEGEAVESCQVRQDAYQMMSKLQSVAIDNLAMSLYADSGDSDTTAMDITGRYEYVVTNATEGLGANVHAWLDSGTLTASDSNDTLNGLEFIIFGTKGYTSADGGKTWTYEEFDPNSDTMLGLSMMLGVGGATGAGLDLFTDPSIFTVTVSDGPTIDGQATQKQVLALDVPTLLSNADALGTLMTEGFSAGGSMLGMTEQDLGLTPEQIAVMSALLLPALQGTAFTTTIYIGQDDGYIHRIEEEYVFAMDTSKLLTSDDSAPVQMKLSYQLSGDISQYNADIQIMEPTGASQGAGLLSDEGGLFGSGGLGSSLFGN